jgi:hypothetical protein
MAVSRLCTTLGTCVTELDIIQCLAFNYMLHSTEKDSTFSIQHHRTEHDECLAFNYMRHRTEHDSTFSIQQLQTSAI